MLQLSGHRRTLLRSLCLFWAVGLMLWMGHRLYSIHGPAYPPDIWINTWREQWLFDRTPEESLHRAIRNHDIARFKLLLPDEATVAQYQRADFSVLNLSLKYEFDAGVDWLLDHKINLTSKWLDEEIYDASEVNNPRGYISVPHYSVWDRWPYSPRFYNHDKQWLTPKGQYVFFTSDDLKAHEPIMGLYAIAMWGNLDQLKRVETELVEDLIWHKQWLKDNWEDDIPRYNVIADTALQAAILSNCPDKVEYLLELGYPANSAFWTGNDVRRFINPYSNLMWLMIYPHRDEGLEERLQIAALLIKYGADINAKYALDGEPIILFCLKYGHREMVELLIRHGVNIHAKGMNDQSLIKEIRHPRNMVLIPRLLKLGLNPLPTEANESALFWIVQDLASLSKADLEPLLSHMTAHGYTPTTEAYMLNPPNHDYHEYEHITLINLIQLGFDPNIIYDDEIQTTLLHEICLIYYEVPVPLMIKMLDHGARLDIKDAKGKTPLDYYIDRYGKIHAALAKHPKVIQHLNDNPYLKAYVEK